MNAPGRALASEPAGAADLRRYRPAIVEPDPLQSDARARGVEERRLLAQAQGGELGAFEELVRIHAQRLHAVLRGLCPTPHDAEEVAQEAFLRAWRAIGRFDGRSQFFTWLYRIGVNEAKRRAEREGPRLRAVPIGEPPYEELADFREAPEPRAERREQRLALERAVRALPIDQRAPLVLRDIEGLSTREGAEVLGLSEAAFKSRLHRARMSVREALKDAELEEGGALSRPCASRWDGEAILARRRSRGISTASSSPASAWPCRRTSATAPAAVSCSHRSRRPWQSWAR